MKKVLFSVGILCWGMSFASASVSDAEINANLDELTQQLNDLEDDFAQGQLLADKSEKDMNKLVLPIFNWFSGINTTNKKNPATITQGDLATYNGLFKNYSKVYGVDDELYNYYAFGRNLLTFLVAVNVLKSDAVRLAITMADNVVAKDLSLSDLADAQACVTAFSSYNDFSKQAVSRGFKKPFSSTLGDVYTEELAIAKKIVSLKDQIAVPVKPQPQKPQPVIPVKSAEELAMDGMLNPLFGALSGSDGGSATDPDSFTAAQAQTYQAAFDVYVKKQGTTGTGYLTYKFGSLLLPALAAKNVLEKDLLALRAGEPNEIVAPEIKPGLVENAQTFSQAFGALQTFLNSASSFTSPLPGYVMSQYEELLPFAAKIISLSSAVVQPVPQKPNPPAPVVTPVITSADAFIMKHFSDKNLSSLSLSDVDTLVSTFNASYDSSDTYYLEYQVWAAYVPVRFRELDLLAKLENKESASVVESAATAFRINYANGFRLVYLQNIKNVRAAYAAQLSAVSLEFGVTDALARLELQKITNNTFSL